MWLHVLRSPGRCKLVCSPDIDVYHIGLPLVYNQPVDEFARVSIYYSQEHWYLSLTLYTRVTLLGITKKVYANNE